jgi:leader peptidase (prepilin peptidase)/N-methyltransferase
MGQGDVTLMAMIGSLLGWQAVILVLALAPVCGVTAGLFVRLITQRSFISFGPWLSMAAVLVLLTWRWLWQLEASDEFSIRKLFGDAPGLGILSAVSVAALALMLAGLRLYRAIPVRNDDRKQPH